MQHRITELRHMLATIDNARTADELGALYVLHIGYSPFESDDLDDLDNVRMTLSDFIKEVACAEGIDWADVIGSAA